MKMRTCLLWLFFIRIYLWNLHLISSALATERGPVIKRSPGNVSVIVERNLTFICEADGHPTPILSWAKRENTADRWEKLDDGDRIKIKPPLKKQSRKKWLIITRLLIKDTGYYRCSADNPIGSTNSEPAYLSVEAPVEIVSPPRNHTAAWGTAVELQCEVIGIPFPRRWWTKNGQTIIDEKTQSFFSDPRLPINATESAVYECRAENFHCEGYTNVSQAAFVTVVDGYCGTYNAAVCRNFLNSPLQSVYLKRSDQNVISRAEVVTSELLKEFQRVGNSFCVDHALQMLCHHNFPQCLNKRDPKPTDICRESCVAVRDLFCQVEWQKVAERFGEFLPDCDRLPSRHNASSSCFNVDLFNITHGQNTTSCYGGVGSHYWGSVNVTEDGLPCQRWSRQVPHRHNHFPSIYPVLEKSGSACRNAGGERERPWCYTMNATVRWQYCNVPVCDADNATQNKPTDTSAFNTETAFIVATVVALPLTLLILIIVIIFRIIMPCIRKPQKNPSADIDISQLVQIPKAEADYPVPALKTFEYHQRNSIAYQRDIGEGAFGTFFLAQTPEIVDGQESTTVVVKTLQAKATPEMEQDFIREVLILAQFDHPNILKILGVCLIGKPWCVLLEYMQHGDLNEFLQSCSPQHFIVRRRSRDSSEQDMPRLSCYEQLKIARQIAAGMLYVVQMGYIHRDLATRNCLVGDQMTVKISDFGLAILLRPGEDHYQGGELEPIPIRWSPLESIVYNQFTSASDVWSFGVLLWEIFSFGERPYYNMSQEDVVRYVREGKILYCPDNTPPEVYELMRICWNQNPTNRPGFEALHQSLFNLERNEMNANTADR